MPFAAMQMELEIIIQVSQKKKTKQISYINTYMRKLKYTNELNQKTQTDSDIENKHIYEREEGVGSHKLGLWD